MAHLRPRRRWWYFAIAVVAALAVAGSVTASAHRGTRGSTTRPSSPHAATTPPTHASKTTTTPASTTPSATQPTTRSTTSSRPSSAHAPTPTCRTGDPLANVYHPYRLTVRRACLTVTGTVVSIRHEDDGDVHLNLALPASETHLLDAANIAHEDGDLVTEIVPADQPGCTPGAPPPLPSTAYRSPSYDYGTCTGADVATPPIGDEVEVTGPYVLDADHGWMEIHPVWSIIVRSTASGSPPPTSAPPAPDTEPAATGSGAPQCRAHAAPAHDGYAGDYDVSIQSNQPNAPVTASDPGDRWSGRTDAAGNATIRLYRTTPGMTVTVTVGRASCTTTA